MDEKGLCQSSVMPDGVKSMPKRPVLIGGKQHGRLCSKSGTRDCQSSH